MSICCCYHDTIGLVLITGSGYIITPLLDEIFEDRSVSFKVRKEEYAEKKRNKEKS